jgi:hypothetical protein
MARSSMSQEMKFRDDDINGGTLEIELDLLGELLVSFKEVGFPLTTNVI